MNYENVINNLKHNLQQAGVLPEAEDKATESLMRQAVALLDQAADMLVSVAENHLKNSNIHNSDLNHALSDVLNFESVAEMLEQYQLEQDARDALESPKKSTLGPDGFTFTDTGLHHMAGRLVLHVRQQSNGKVLQARVWPYRHDREQMISCDFTIKGTDQTIPVSVSALGEQCAEPVGELTVYDMTEALHLIGMVTRALDAEVTIGRYRNERNVAVLAQPLQAHQTNGPINLWGKGGEHA